MRRIFTSTILVAAVLVASFNSFGQTCAVSTTNPSPSPGFGTSYTITAGEGFSGTASPMNVFPTPSSNSITSPGRFYFNTDQTAVNFRVTLTPNGNKNVVVNSYSISVKYGGGVGVTQTCTNNSPSLTIPNAGAVYYFSISNS